MRQATQCRVQMNVSLFEGTARKTKVNQGLKSRRKTIQRKSKVTSRDKGQEVGSTNSV